MQIYVLYKYYRKVNLHTRCMSVNYMVSMSFLIKHQMLSLQYTLLSWTWTLTAPKLDSALSGNLQCNLHLFYCTSKIHLTVYVHCTLYNSYWFEHFFANSQKCVFVYSRVGHRILFRSVLSVLFRSLKGMFRSFIKNGKERKDRSVLL